MKFKLNDYVRVKSGVTLEETGEPVPGWVGRIDELPQNADDLVYLFELDSESLANLPEKYLGLCIQEEEPPTAYYFLEHELEPATRRDTDEQLRAAQDRAFDLVMGPDENEDLDTETVRQWLSAYQADPAFAKLPEPEREETEDIVKSFAEFAFNYELEQPGEWTAGVVRSVCTEIMPRKVSAEPEYFERIGPVLAHFFGFLAEQNLQPNAKSLQQETLKIAPQIVRNAADPAYWGMAKSMMMGAFDAGIDPSNEADLERYFMAYSAGLMQQLEREKSTRHQRPATENSYKHLSRNQVIRVKYPDGTIRDGKFKRLEADLRAGKCELLQ